MLLCITAICTTFSNKIINDGHNVSSVLLEFRTTWQRVFILLQVIRNWHFPSAGLKMKPILVWFVDIHVIIFLFRALSLAEDALYICQNVNQKIYIPRRDIRVSLLPSILLVLCVNSICSWYHVVLSLFYVLLF